MGRSTARCRSSGRLGMSMCDKVGLVVLTSDTVDWDGLHKHQQFCGTSAVEMQRNVLES